MTTQARDLLEHGLKDIYDAEHRFASALGEMIENTTDRTLADGFRRHREITNEQTVRLESAFGDLGVRPQRESCAAAVGLVREYQKFVEDNAGDADMHDAFAAGAALKVEHYEIASYRPLVDLAEFLELKDCARALKKNLAEEEAEAANVQSSATKLGGELAGASTLDLTKRAVGTTIDQAREHTYATVGTTRAVGERVAGTAKKAVRKAERRGRKVVKRARTQAKTKTKTTATRTRKTVTRAKPSTRKTTTARRKSTGPRRKTASRSTARRTSAKRGSKR